MLKERVITGLSGWTMVAILVAGPIAGVAGLRRASAMTTRRPSPSSGSSSFSSLDLIGWRGLTIVNPNTARVILLFGRYQGTIKTPGCAGSIRSPCGASCR